MGLEEELAIHSLDIATKVMLRGHTLQQVAREYNVAPSTLHRALRRWREDGRFELVDKKRTQGFTSETDEDRELADRLVRKTNLWRARVVSVGETQASETGDYLADPGTPVAMAAYTATDVLHWALGGVAADVLLDRLKPSWVVGLASGRGAGFTVSRCEDAVQRVPSRARGLNSIRIVSLSGGQQVGPWGEMRVSRALDADANCFELSQVLQVPEDNVTYMANWISSPEPPQFRCRLDMALVGVGVLNTQHFFYRYLKTVQLAAMRAPLERIRSLQAADPKLLHRVADIAHRLFPVGDEAVLPDDLLDAIGEVNRVVVAALPETIKDAEEIILVAAGAQKLPVLHSLVSGECPQATADPRRMILVTDRWTAQQICDIADGKTASIFGKD